MVRRLSLSYVTLLSALLLGACLDKVQEQGTEGPDAETDAAPVPEDAEALTDGGKGHDAALDASPGDAETSEEDASVDDAGAELGEASVLPMDAGDLHAIPSGLWIPPEGAVPETGNYIYLQSQFGDPIGAGNSYLYTAANALLSANASGNHVSVSVTGDERWSGDFATEAATELEVGYWGVVAGYPLQNADTAELDWSGEGRGCGPLTGWFVVDDIAFDGDKLSRLDLRFEQRCGGSVVALHGAIHWDSSDTTLPPGPIDPPPQNLWQPEPGALPSSGNYVYLESQSGDYIGRGRHWLYTKADAILTITTSNGALTMRVGGDERWTGNFAGMIGLTQFEPGYYGNLQNYPLNNPAKGGIDWSGEGRACSTVTGWFVIDDVSYMNNQVQTVDLRFEQHCEGMTAALRGAIRWDRDDPTVPPGPQTPPSDLWKAADGATPQSGTYVYLESDFGDYAGGDQTLLYEAADSTISIEAWGVEVFVSMQDWTGVFVGMLGLSQLEPGYYGDLERYPVHNAVKGGLDWYGTGRSCGELSGWFVVDAVAYQGLTLESLDLRFEQYCDGYSSALHGQLHYDAP